MPLSKKMKILIGYARDANKLSYRKKILK